MKHIFRWWRGDPEALERAKRAAAEASETLAKAREDGIRAERLLDRNSLSTRFLRDMKRKHLEGHA